MDTVTALAYQVDRSTDAAYLTYLVNFEIGVERLVDAEIANIRATPLGTRRRRKPTKAKAAA